MALGIQKHTLGEESEPANSETALELLAMTRVKALKWEGAHVSWRNMMGSRQTTGPQRLPQAAVCALMALQCDLSADG